MGAENGGGGDCDGSGGDRTGGAPERLLVALLALGVVPALVLARALDDNRLTSWQWTLGGVDPLRLYALTALALVVALLVADARLLDRRPATALFVLALAAGACLRGEPEVIPDASRYFSEAKYLEVYGLWRFLADWGRALPAWTDLPLVPLLHGAAFAVLGESRAVAQGLGLLFFAGSVALTQRIGAALWDERTGLAAGALLLAMPYLLTQVPLLLVDVPTMFFVTLAVLATTRAVRRGRLAGALAAAGAVALAMLTKYSAWLLVPLVPVVALALRGSAAPRAARVAAVVVGLPLVAMVTLGLGRLDVVAVQATLLARDQAPGLGRWHEGWASTLAFQIHPFVTGAAVLSAVVAARRRDRRWLVAALPVVVLLGLGVGRIRYLVPALPMLALLAAYGLQVVRERALDRAVAACAVAGSLVVALGLFLPFLERSSASNLAAAGAYLDSLAPGPVDVVTLPATGSELNPATWVPLLDLETHRTLAYEYEEPSPATMELARGSPLRFTWEYRNPPWYLGREAGRAAAVVVVSGDLAGALPPPLASRLAEYRLARELAADEGAFRAKSFVRVYVPARVASPDSASPPDGGEAGATAAAR